MSSSRRATNVLSSGPGPSSSSAHSMCFFCGHEHGGLSGAQGVSGGGLAREAGRWPQQLSQNKSNSSPHPKPAACLQGVPVQPGAPGPAHLPNPHPQIHTLKADSTCKAFEACLQRVEVQQEFLVLGSRLADHVDQQVGHLQGLGQGCSFAGFGPGLLLILVQAGSCKWHPSALCQPAHAVGATRSGRRRAAGSSRAAVPSSSRCASHQRLCLPSAAVPPISGCASQPSLHASQQPSRTLTGEEGWEPMAETTTTCLASEGPDAPCSTRYLQIASMRSAAATHVPPNLCTCGRVGAGWVQGGRQRRSDWLRGVVTEMGGVGVRNSRACMQSGVQCPAMPHMHCNKVAALSAIHHAAETLPQTAG